MKRLLLFVMLMVSCSMLQAAADVKKITVGVVTDAPSESYMQMQDLIFDELNTLGKGTYTFQPYHLEQTGNSGNVIEISDALKRMQGNNDIDVILTLGMVSGTVAVSTPQLRKPTFAPFLVRFDGQISKNGGSGITNFNYLETGSAFGKAIEQFKGGVHFTHLSLLLDAAYFEVLKPQRSRLDQVAKDNGVALSFVTAENDIVFLENIPVQTDAVMIAPLPRLSTTSKQNLLEGLKARKLPSYTFDEAASVEAGALMGTRSADDMQRRARQMALNIYEVLRGEKAEQQSVSFELKSPLKINMQTARAIGVSPPFGWLKGTVQLYQFDADKSERLTLADAAREAVQANLSLVAGMISVKADKEGVNEVRSILFPQLHAGLGYTQNNSDNVYVESGFYAEKSTAGSIRLEQLIFSERTLAQLDIAKSRHEAIEAQQRLLELDIVYRTASAYLGVLYAQERLTIRQEQLELVRTNYELAQGRVDVGVSDRSDLYHWESMITSERINVLSAEAELRKARDFLCTLLHREMNVTFGTKEITLDDPELMISRDGVTGLVFNETTYQRLEQFYITEALQYSPELWAQKSLITAASRKLKSDERSYWSPNIAAYGETTRVFDESRVAGATINMEDQTNWEAGVVINLPLYEGGARGARSEQSQLKLQELRTRQVQLEEELSRRIRADLHAMRASHPAIELSQQALQAAKKSYDLVSQNYAAGTRSMTDLLVVQTVRLNARQGTADAFYRFMHDLMALQYDSGRFDFFMSDTEKDDVVKQLQQHVGTQAENYTKQGSDQ